MRIKCLTQGGIQTQYLFNFRPVFNHCAIVLTPHPFIVRLLPHPQTWKVQHHRHRENRKRFKHFFSCSNNHRLQTRRNEKCQNTAGKKSLNWPPFARKLSTTLGWAGPEITYAILDPPSRVRFSAFPRFTWPTTFFTSFMEVNLYPSLPHRWNC